eukprot:TRINITY_DN1479_c0_g1_i4.p1 TRINITY_DN1479_c0_g1~~TRINITY_DN1479_c0_g1_i4.p1  ORF type:complete len:760 (+),score=124.92 TRINITY_DN1479_c0_g1_i4:104-2383(+)
MSVTEIKNVTTISNQGSSTLSIFVSLGRWIAKVFIINGFKDTKQVAKDVSRMKFKLLRKKYGIDTNAVYIPKTRIEKQFNDVFGKLGVFICSGHQMIGKSETLLNLLDSRDNVLFFDFTPNLHRIEAFPSLFKRMGRKTSRLVDLGENIYENEECIERSIVIAEKMKKRFEDKQSKISGKKIKYANQMARVGRNLSSRAGNIVSHSRDIKKYVDELNTLISNETVNGPIKKKIIESIQGIRICVDSMYKCAKKAQSAIKTDSAEDQMKLAELVISGVEEMICCAILIKEHARNMVRHSNELKTARCMAKDTRVLVSRLKVLNKVDFKERLIQQNSVDLSADTYEPIGKVIDAIKDVREEAKQMKKRAKRIEKCGFWRWFRTWGKYRDCHIRPCQRPSAEHEPIIVFEHASLSAKPESLLTAAHRLSKFATVIIMVSDGRLEEFAKTNHFSARTQYIYMTPRPVFDKDSMAENFITPLCPDLNSDQRKIVAEIAKERFDAVGIDLKRLGTTVLTYPDLDLLTNEDKKEKIFTSFLNVLKTQWFSWQGDNVKRKDMMKTFCDRILKESIETFNGHPVTGKMLKAMYQKDGEVDIGFTVKNGVEIELDINHDRNAVLEMITQKDALAHISRKNGLSVTSISHIYISKVHCQAIVEIKDHFFGPNVNESASLNNTTTNANTVSDTNTVSDVAIDINNALKAKVAELTKEMKATKEQVEFENLEGSEEMKMDDIEMPVDSNMEREPIQTMMVETTEGGCEVNVS